jgi:hypothetical protein
VIASGDDQNVIYPGLDEAFNGISYHGPIVDRQKVLIGNFCQRVQPRAQTSRQYDTLHGKTPSKGRIRFLASMFNNLLILPLLFYQYQAHKIAHHAVRECLYIGLPVPPMID